MAQTARLPLIGNINTRVGVNDQLPGVSAIVGEAIVGMVVVGTTPVASSKDQRFINFFPIVYANKVSGQQTVYMVKRPGFAEHEQPQAGSPGSAIHVWAGQGDGSKVISAFGSAKSSLYDGTTKLVTNNTDTTTISGVATGITETLVSGTPTLLISSSDSTAWYYQNAGTVTKVTSASFPGNAGKTLAGTFAHLDGYAFIMTTDAGIYNSALNSVTTWPAINVLSARTDSEVGVGCVRWRRYIVAFTQRTVRFFRHFQADVGTPLVREDDLTQKIGLCNANAIVEHASDLYWVGANPQGGIGVYTLSSGLRKISTPAIDVKLQLAGSANISCAVFSIFGTAHVFIRASTLTLAYCIEQDFWYEVSGPEMLWTRSAATSIGSGLVCYALSTVSTSGKTYILSPSQNVFQDDGATYTGSIITAPVDMDTDGWKKWIKLAVIADREVEQSDLSVSWSDDDYQSFNTANARTLDLSSSLTHARRLGRSKRRIWRFDHSADTPARIRAVEITYKRTGA